MVKMVILVDMKVVMTMVRMTKRPQIQMITSHTRKVSEFNGLTQCYVFNVAQYNTVFILFWTEIDKTEY